MTLTCIITMKNLYTLMELFRGHHYITVTHVMLLCHLARCDDESLGDDQRNLSACAFACGVTAAAMTCMVDRMEQIGWVLRRDSSVDRRSYAVHLGPEGSRIMAQVRALLQDMN